MDTKEIMKIESNINLLYKSSFSVHLLFDGECLMCNYFIKFLDKNLTCNALAYSSFDLFLKDHQGIEHILKKNNINPQKTIIVLDASNLYSHSGAISKLLICCKPKIYKLFSYLINFFSIYSIGDFFYKIISKYRKKFFKISDDFCLLTLNKITIR